MRIRTKLMALLVAVAAAPVALAGLVAYRAARNALATAIAESHARAAQAEAEITAGYLDPIVAELTGALLHEDPAALRPAEVSEYLTRVFLRRNRIAIAALLDERRAVAATVFVDDPEVFARSEPQFRLHDTVAAAEAEAFQKVAIDLAARISPDRAYAVSDPYLAAVRRKPAVALLVAPPPGRHTLLAAEVTLDELSRRLTETYPSGARAFVLDRGGRVVVHADREAEKRRDRYAVVLPQAVGATAPGVAEYADQGVIHLAAYAPVAGLGWTAVVARPKDEVLGPLRALSAAIAAVLIATLVVASLGAAAMARALARPIAQLTKGALEFAMGHLAYRIDLDRKDEMGDLARTFNQMGDALAEANGRLMMFNDELKRQVEERTRELKEAQQQLLRTQRLAALADLAAGVAHEVNNPLWAVVGNAQLLLQETAAGTLTHHMLEDIESEALRIQGIVTGLLALSETERGDLVPTDVHRAIQRALSAIAPELERCGIAWERRFSEGLSPVLGDGNLLGQLFDHLLKNARAALDGRPGPRVTVTTAGVDGQAVRIEVADNGRGIAKEHLERIFDPFFTTDGARRGQGLGLTVCHRIVENHGGKITVQSQEGAGTTVTVLLPAAPPSPHLR